MKVQIILSGLGGELNNVTIDVSGHDDPAISQAVADMALNGVQTGDTITVVEARAQLAESQEIKILPGLRVTEV